MAGFIDAVRERYPPTTVPRAGGRDDRCRVLEQRDRSRGPEGRSVPPRPARVAQPVQQPLPVVAADQHHRVVRAPCRSAFSVSTSNSSSSVPKPPGRTTNAARVAHEHQLADEEVVELDGDVAIGVQSLLVGKLDVEADRERSRLARPAVGRLHQSRPAAGDHGDAGSPIRPAAPCARARTRDGRRGGGRSRRRRPPARGRRGP